MEKKELPGYNLLKELALDMRWSWNHEADQIWEALDKDLWNQTHNPWTVLRTISSAILQQKFEDPGFRTMCEHLLNERSDALSAPSWFSTTHGDAPLKCVAYFSMEFMLSEALPIYVGGLGNVAGDQLKSAADLGVPVVGIGLLYQQGYFRQVIDDNGEQQAYYPYNDPGQLPIKPLRTTDGDWLRLKVPFPGGHLWIRTWEVQVGRAKLYLLDTNDSANPAPYRGISAEIYGGDMNMRIKQEMILGLGGWHLLEALGIHPDICHLNEGHAAFAILDRCRSFMQANKVSFAEALAVTRAGNLFTTHTAVAAGFDHFDAGQMSYHLGAYAWDNLQLPFNELMALGRQNPNDPNEPFNMAYLAIAGSGAVNGVSKLHGAVSRHLFAPLFNRWPVHEVPVGHVTNGVHTPSWDSPPAEQLWEEIAGKDRWKFSTENMTEEVKKVDDARLWKMRNESRSTLVEYIRVKTNDPKLFDPNILTLGFARRFVAYKRVDLLLHDPERLVRILTNSQQPVQLVLAGKAPPSDGQGRDLIRRWTQFIRQYKMYAHVIFMEDYDMLLAAHMVQGVDVWINTPRRPWEASGTSGMKVLVNGGLNLSELDGWWVEAYTPEVGWALGDGKEHGEDPNVDNQEAQDLYRILEQEVIPSFYNRNDQQIPGGWVQKMRQSMATLTPHYSANRTVREYTENFYIPGTQNYQARAANGGEEGKQIVHWETAMDQGFGSLRFGDVKYSQVDDEYHFEVPVYLNGVNPSFVKVQLYTNGTNGAPDAFTDMQASGQGDANSYTLYTGTVKADRAATDYTARLVPYNEELKIPLEYKKILWQR